MKKYQIKVDDPELRFAEVKGLVAIGVSFDIKPDDCSIRIKPPAIDADMLRAFPNLGLKELGIVTCFGLLRYHYLFLLSISLKSRGHIHIPDLDLKEVKLRKDAIKLRAETLCNQAEQDWHQTHKTFLVTVASDNIHLSTKFLLYKEIFDEIMMHFLAHPHSAYSRYINAISQNLIERKYQWLVQNVEKYYCNISPNIQILKLLHNVMVKYAVHELALFTWLSEKHYSLLFYRSFLKATPSPAIKIKKMITFEKDAKFNMSRVGVQFFEQKSSPAKIPSSIHSPDENFCVIFIDPLFSMNHSLADLKIYLEHLLKNSKIPAGTRPKLEELAVSNNTAEQIISSLKEFRKAPQKDQPHFRG